MPVPVVPPSPAVKSSRLAMLASLLTAEAVFGALLFVAAFGVFFYLTRVVFKEHSVTFDNWGFAQMARLQAAWPWTYGVMKGITFFGSVLFFVPASLLVPLALYWRGFKRYAIELLLAMGGGLILNELLKVYFHRARPATAFFHQYGYSFPSGHAMLSMAYYGCLAWLVVQHSGRWGLATALVGFALLIGSSRIYFNVHYPTDVVAGFAGGASWLLMLRAGVRLFWKGRKEVNKAVPADR